MSSAAVADKLEAQGFAVGLQSWTMTRRPQTDPPTAAEMAEIMSRRPGPPVVIPPSVIAPRR